MQRWRRRTNALAAALWIGLALAVGACDDGDGDDGDGDGDGDDGDGDGDGDGDAGVETGSETGEDVVTIVDTSGACGIICDGGRMACTISGLDPVEGLQACTQRCQRMWELEQDCVGEAAFVIECVDANRSCRTLEEETCGNFFSGALAELYVCLGLQEPQ
jgi:hypothetical protein